MNLGETVRLILLEFAAMLKFYARSALVSVLVESDFGRVISDHYSHGYVLWRGSTG